MASADYSARLAAEEEIYRDCTEVHDLPAIFHYWSDRYTRPMMEPFGFRNPQEFFTKHLAEQCAASEGIKRFASIGCGNGDLEIDLAQRLRALGHANFVMDCVDLNEAMLERGRVAADAAGLAEQMNFVQGDLNNWSVCCEYDAVVAHQFLHHVVNLELLFAEIKSCLRPDGIFVISDMIGRNGHARWPEALTLVREFWKELPPAYRYNQQLRRKEDVFQEWDCSKESFEGIRAQDILRLLIARFKFRVFIGFGNVIDPFVDRSFGYNFDAEAVWDRDFVDRVHACDEREIMAGRLKPTHMLAVVGKTSDGLATRAHLTPEFCLRVPDSPDERSTWPESARIQIEGMQAKLAAAEVQAAEASQQVPALAEQQQKLRRLFEERTQWALDLDRQLQQERQKLYDLKYRPWRSVRRWLRRGSG